jgi:hypothetical protein
MTGETQTIEELVARALAPYSERPDTVGVAQLIDDLITAGQELHAKVSATASWTCRVKAALDEWAYFAGKGPVTDGDHAAWNHARGLARIIQSMRSGLDSAASR